MQEKKQARLPAEERRKTILEAALKLFAEKGFEETKTKAIADAVGISEAAMFKHFKSKEELVTQSLEYKFGCHRETQHAAFLASLDMTKTVPEDALRSIGNKAFELIEENIDLIRVIIYSIMKHPDKMRKYIKQNIREDERIFKRLTEQSIRNQHVKPLDADIVSKLFPMMVVALALTNYLSEGKVSSEKKRKKTVETLLEIYLHGILA